MQPHASTEKSPENPNEELQENEDHNNGASKTGNDDSDCVPNNEDSVLDVSDKRMEFSLLEGCKESVDGLYVYKNVFNLVPKSVGAFGRVRNFKFFGNKINLFPAEFGNLVGLECLQVKISSPGFSGLVLSKLKGLKELELSRVPPRPSVLTMLSEIAALKGLTKLSVCHFYIRYLPPEIGCLKKLEYLDLSFNKMKFLPAEISHLNALISLKVANNKLVELPSGLSSLQRLENLDLSNNRLTSLVPVELLLMCNLKTLNLQLNKLPRDSQIPSWIHCNLDGNNRSMCEDDFVSSSVEMDVQENDGTVSYIASDQSSSKVTVSASNSRCFASRRSSKRWKRRHYLQQRARQECLNNSWKWKGKGRVESLTMKDGVNAPKTADVLKSETWREEASEIVRVDDDGEHPLPADAEDENIAIQLEDDKSTSKGGFYAENLSSIDHNATRQGVESECPQKPASLPLVRNEALELDEGSSAETSITTSKSKRHSERDLDNPKPCKFRKPVDNCYYLSRKYSTISFCGTEDYLPDGFYDAGRDRPFMPLSNYEDIVQHDSREVILLDRERDEELDAIALSAQALVFHLKHLNGLARNRERIHVDDMQIASLLALFVSDHFGGSDRSSVVSRTRKQVSGSNYSKPFVCTCSTGTSDYICAPAKISDSAEEIALPDLCEKSLRSIKLRRNSIVVPLGTLRFGVCRHRALLMKYLCDRMEPPVPCELVRGYLDFMPHAWNIIPIKKGDGWVRMVVDSCHPYDIREETDPEYVCRYIPFSCANVSLVTQSSPVGYSFPSLSTNDEIGKGSISSIVRCKFESVEAVAKLRTLDTKGLSCDEVRKFEYSFLGEVRILGALKHPCIVKMYGHQLSSKWDPMEDPNPERRILQSAIFMEYVKGGSLKSHIEKLAEAGEKHMEVESALSIAQDIASALVELHSKHILHRDIKSENIVIDLDKERDDGSPLVKLCDFDRAVPLKSFLHGCCIAHIGIHPPDVCVGTPRWMAPEVLRTIHNRNAYGMEVDIWSYGCLLCELLTLQNPYCGLSELEMHEHIQMGKRPPLTDELEALRSVDAITMGQASTEHDKPEAEVDKLRFLVGLFHRCTVENPSNRPTAKEVYEMLVEQRSKFRSSK